ncbi:hypothetical protein HA145_07140 [Prochlorococcus marinus XMU1411]|uniref:GumC family protein n=1 Tax=Prochlorococcus marinus TaxID=1219 RepID=UPI001AD9D832|nr:Wzz/FepE/Etk N-terminal domain-containing protein [Prochlorococcus marinus]MBO8244250.1 hypothetical protein [Prochlorococcus marinus XMU1411]MCR8537078.1 Wzz/FepE/Etk N-terminal domain-containing protein [Prochlorococcus marinus CUG1430]
MTEKKSIINSIDKSVKNDDIEIRPIIEKIIRNKIFILSFALLSSFISAIVAINTPKLWEGEFQIVYDEEGQRSAGGALGNLDFSIFNIGSASRLNTQINVLKSPFVLMDIYQNVKKQRNDKSLTFKKWTKSLDIEIIEETNVVKVVYKDQDKILLKKVLEDISRSYEIYRKDKRKRDIAKSMDFLELQIKKYEDKSNKDYAELLAYANQQSMFVPTVLNDLTATRADQFMAAQIDSFNRLKEIELTIEQLKKIPIDSDEVFAKTSLVDNKEERIPEYRTYLDNEIKLSNLRKIFKDEDISIQTLIAQRSNLRKEIRSKLFSYLLAEKNLLTAKVESLNRSQDKLNKFGNLLRIALKSKTTLDAMEQNYIQLSLEKSNDLNEAQIITKPTILPYAVAPLKKRMVITTFLFSLIFASLISYIFEKLRNILSSKYELSTIIRNKTIDHLQSNQTSEWKDIISILIKSMNLDSKSKTVFYQFGAKEDFEISYINEILEDLLGENNFLITSNISDLLKYKQIICLVYLGVVKKSEFQKLTDRLNSIPDLNISYLTID